MSRTPRNGAPLAIITLMQQGPGPSVRMGVGFTVPLIGVNGARLQPRLKWELSQLPLVDRTRLSSYRKRT